MPWAAKAVWVKRAPDGRLSFAVHPPGASETPGGNVFLLTNDADALAELLVDSGTDAAGTILSLADVFRFAFPASSSETVAQMMATAASGATGDAAGLWQVWQALQTRLTALPLWALETMELSLREVGEKELARFLGCCATEVRMSGRMCGHWRDSFASQNMRQTKRPVVRHADCTPLNEEDVVRRLQPEGPLARQMPGYEPRPGQLEMLRAVVRAFNAEKHLLVEAGTGVGKSVAYLLPAALWSQLNDVPVIVSTNTRNLQTQLLDKDLPLVRQVVEAAGRPLRIALLKGRTNYLCLRRLGGLLDHGQYDMERDELRVFARVVAWAVQTSDGDLDALAGGADLSNGALARLSSLGEECNGRACRFYRRCFLQKARDRSLQAHVIIANHALVFAEMGTPGVALPAAAQIIFDEAHNLEEAATRHFSIEVTPMRLATVLRRLSHGSGRHASGVLELLRRQVEKGDLGNEPDRRKALQRRLRELGVEVESAQTAGQRFFRALYDLSAGTSEPRRFRRTSPGAEPGFVGGVASRVPGEDAAPKAEAKAGEDAWNQAAEAVRLFKEVAARIDERLRNLADEVRLTTEGELSLHEDEALDLEACGHLLVTFASDADFVLAGMDDAHVFWVQRSRQRDRLGEAWAAPLRIGPRLAAELYARKSTVVFCSATLRVSGSFSFVAGRLGADRIPGERLGTCVAASPFDYQRQCAVLAPTFLPEPGGDGRAYAEQLSALMLDVCVLTRGRAMGLFTSYEMMRRCAIVLREPLAAEGIRLLVQGENGSRDQITRIFRAGGASVLLGTHSFWEGVDVVGDALSCVVMARLPFAAVGEPMQEARCEQVEAEGGNGFANFSLPGAVIRFRQGFGRLIRHREDRGVVIVADPRLVTRRYSARFRLSLPCAVEVVQDREALLGRVQSVLS